MFTISSACFVLGGLSAVGLRSVQRINEEQARAQQGLTLVQKQADDLAAKYKESEDARAAMKRELAAVQTTLAGRGKLSVQQINALNNRIKELQLLAGLTPVTGPGLRITLQDNPEVAKENSEGALPGLPGIVHDYDVLQVVNELRAAGADAIAVKGIRITGYTPIRCVGPAILINGRPVPAPFVIEAIGDPGDLHSALSMPNGIVDNLKNTGGIQVSVAEVKSLRLPDAGDLPTPRHARVTN